MKKTYHYILSFFLVIFFLLCSPALRSEDISTQLSEITGLISTGNYNSAISKLNSYARSSTDIEEKAEIYYRIGFIYFEYVHNYVQALEAYKKVVNLGKQAKSPSPDLEIYIPLSQMSIAYTYQRLGKYDDAIKTYRKVASDYPGTQYAVTAEKDIKGIQDALLEIQLYEEIISKYPNSELAAEFQFEIAELCLSEQGLNDPERAIKEYAKLVEQYPDSHRTAEAQLKIGNTYWMVLHRPEEAIATYQKLLQNQYSVSKLGAEALFRIGRIYYSDLRDYTRACEAFTKFVRDYPTYWKFPAAVYWQGMCYENLGDYDNAIRVFELFVRIYPDEMPGWLADIGKLGEINVKSQIESKIQELKKLAPQAQWQYARKLNDMGKYREALNIYRDLIGRYPDSEYSKKAKAEMDRIGFFAEIEICKDAVRRKDESAPAAQYRIGEIYEFEIKDFNRALKEYESTQANYPGTQWAAESLFRMGYIYSGSESKEFRLSTEAKKKNGALKPDYRKAIEKYQQVIKDYPKTYIAAKAQYQIGEIYKNYLKDYDKALEAYGKVVTNYPQRSFYVGEGFKDSLADEAQFEIGRIYYEKLNNLDMALKSFTKFLNNYPDSCRKAATYSFMAWIQEKQNDRKLAISSLQKIIDLISASSIQTSFFMKYSILEARQGEVTQGLGYQQNITKQLRQKISRLQNQ